MLKVLMSIINEKFADIDEREKNDCFQIMEQYLEQNPDLTVMDVEEAVDDYLLELRS
jgi:hypothetical protein